MKDLRFTCIPGCTNCCRVQGYVYLSEADVKRAAAHVGLSARAFEKRYVYRTKHLLRLRKPRHSQCHFLVEGGCAIHEAKPTQCRAFPFWPELVGDAKAWRAAAKECPGIGKGELVRIESALRVANDMREALSGVYS